MHYKILLLIISVCLLAGCNQDIKDKKNINLISEQKYKNTGFALIFNDEFKQENKIAKNIDNRSLLIFHKSLKKNSFVKITNPLNQKAVIAKVASNKINFSDFYNSVITDRIAEEISLDLNEPYIDLVLITQNSMFVVKKAKTFDEEKNVAKKVPVDGIKIDNLNDKKPNNKKFVQNNNFQYYIKIADFYYKDSANNMVGRIINETAIKFPLIKKLSRTKYRVLLGPFNDIKKLEESFNEIKLLNFENLQILRNV